MKAKRHCKIHAFFYNQPHFWGPRKVDLKNGQKTLGKLLKGNTILILIKKER